MSKPTEEQVQMANNIAKDLTDEDVLKLARGIYKNQIFTSAQVPPHADPALCFLPVLFGAFEEVERILTERGIRIGLIYGDMGSALPRGVNGLPMLTNASILSESNAKKVIDKYNEIRELLGEK
jgi:hypothetical protein